MNEQALVYFQQEARGIARRALMPAALAVREAEAPLRPRERHESQAALLLHALGRVGPAGGQDALAQAAEEDVGELQALGGVDGHELHSVAAGVRVAVGEEGHVGEVVRQRALLSARLLIFADGLLELREVVQTLLTALGAQMLFVAAAVEHLREQLRDAPFLAACGELLHQRDELPGLGAAEELLVQIAAERVVERAGVFHRILAQVFHPAPPKVPPRHVRHAQEGEVVPVGKQAQVAERVLHLRAREELDAAVYDIGQLQPQEDLLDAARDVVRAIEYGHVAVGDAALVQLGNARTYAPGLVLGTLTVHPDHRRAGGQGGGELLFHAVAVFAYEAVRRGEYLGRGAVVLHHHDGLRAGKLAVEVQQELHARPAPGVDGLVGVSDDEKVFVVAAERAHEAVLGLVYVLELVHHDVLQPLLPLAAYLALALENVEGEEDEVVVVQAEALFLLVEVAVEDDVPRADGVEVLPVQGLQVHVYHVEVVFGVLDALAELYHVPRVGVCHVAQGEAALFVDAGEHDVDVSVVEDEEAFGVLHRVTVLLEHGDAEAVEGADVAGVAVAGECAYALAHLGGGLVREGDAEDAAGRDTQLVYKVGKAAREGARLTGARAGHDADVALRRSDRLALTAVQAFQNIHAIAPFGISIPFRGSRVQKARRFCAGPFRMCLV